MADEKVEVVHLNAKPIPCGVDRVKGLKITGDRSLITCSGCKGTKSELKATREKE